MSISRRLWIFLSVWLIAGGLLAIWASPASASDPVDEGFRDFNYSGSECNSTPTGEKPESKLWYNDGIWWGSLCNPTTNDYHIYRLDFATQDWLDTGTKIDTRANSKADVLWDQASNKLYVVSHLFTNIGQPNVQFSQQGHLFRYSYNSTSKSYSLDAGFPISVTGGRSETLTLAKDSTGQLWVTYVESGQVYVNHSTTNDLTWRTPYTLPVALTATSVTTDDISAVISFQDNIGVMWSNQNQQKFYFAVHQDGTADNLWQVDPEDLPGSPCSGACADDLMNLKVDSTGRIFAAVKTSLTANPDPLVMLLVRNLDDTWDSHVFGVEQNSHTRPVVLLDEENDRLYLFATSPENGGKIYYKSTDIDSINFPAGLGTLFISSDTEGDINNPASTKQNLNGETNLVVLASDGTDRYYFHNVLNLSSAAPPAAPVANFSGTPTLGLGPLQVQFTDQSTGGAPVAWSWNFGDGGVSHLENPSHTYNSPGVYTVVLTVTNAGGTDAETKTGYITVTPPPPVANFSGTPTSGVAPLQVQFTDLSTNSPTSWSWNFGDGGSSTQQNPSYTYNTPGLYTVVLTATNTGGSDAETKTAYINVTVVPVPVANFSGTPTSGDVPLTVQFTDQSTNSPTSWSWNFGDGGSSTQQSPSHTYNSPGVYTVILTATNAGGSDAETKTGYITVDPSSVFQYLPLVIK
jgi:PKD repeat protein